MRRGDWIEKAMCEVLAIKYEGCMYLYMCIIWNIDRDAAMGTGITSERGW